MIPRAIAADWIAPPATDGRLLELHAYWLSICRNGEIPLRKDFSPATIRKLLPSVFLIEVTGEPREFRFRLVGTAFAQAAGREITGLLTSGVFPPDFNLEVLEHWGSVVEKRKPLWGAGQMWVKERDFLKWHGVVLPLQAETAEVTQLLGAGIFDIAKN
jgi:hypothetical protein